MNLKKINKRNVAKLIAFVIGFTGFLLVRDLMTNDSSFAAQFADNILRPIFGNTSTIKLESALFNTQDKLQQIISRTESSKIIVDSKVEWQTLVEKNNDSAHPIIQTATYYPDPNRTYTLVHLVKFDTNQILVDAVAGTKEPASEVGMPGPGVVPDNIKLSNTLLSAFNGGFQYRDGQYGMVVDGITYLPLKEGLATFLVNKNGEISIEEYQNSLKINDYRVMRQNGEMLIKDGRIIPNSTDKLAKVWGRSVTSNMYTQRSGIGITGDGKLIYAAGTSLIPQTLGESLLAAGAVNAMQLDINPFWVRISLFRSLGNGTYEHQSPFAKMYDGGKEFLTGHKKDFFYVYLRNPTDQTSLNYVNARKGWNSEK